RVVALHARLSAVRQGLARFLAIGLFTFYVAQRLVQPDKCTHFPYKTVFRSGQWLAYVVVDVLAKATEQAAALGATIVRDAACSGSEEHTSELQSLTNLVCHLLLQKKSTTINATRDTPSHYMPDPNLPPTALH